MNKKKGYIEVIEVIVFMAIIAGLVLSLSLSEYSQGLRKYAVEVRACSDFCFSKNEIYSGVNTDREHYALRATECFCVDGIKNQRYPMSYGHVFDAAQKE